MAPQAARLPPRTYKYKIFNNLRHCSVNICQQSGQMRIMPSTCVPAPTDLEALAENALQHAISIEYPATAPESARRCVNFFSDSRVAPRRALYPEHRPVRDATFARTGTALRCCVLSGASPRRSPQVARWRRQLRTGGLLLPLGRYYSTSWLTRAALT